MNSLLDMFTFLRVMQKLVIDVSTFIFVWFFNVKLVLLFYVYAEKGHLDI